MHKITANKGFQITFDNGCTISVQWGNGNYCDNHTSDPASTGQPVNPSKTAEVAIILPSGAFYRIQEHDDVIGWQSANDVARWIAIAAELEGDDS